MKIKKYNELRTSKASEVKNSVDQAKVIEIQHYNEPIFYLVCSSAMMMTRDEFENKYPVFDIGNWDDSDLKRAKELKENS